MFEQLIKDVKSLGLPKGSYALFGSAPIIVRNIREASHDIDILVTEDVWHHYRGLSEWEIKMLDSGEEYLEWRGKKIELYKKWGPGNWNESELLASAEEIDDLMYIPLQTVLDWKLRCGREKDLSDAELIRKYMKNI